MRQRFKGMLSTFEAHQGEDKIPAGFFHPTTLADELTKYLDGSLTHISQFYFMRQ